MKTRLENTPPSSIDGDDIEEGAIYLDEMEEIGFDDEDMEEVMAPEENEDFEAPKDYAFYIFNKHEGSVFSCDLHPNGKLAVTGGEDDKAYVWSVETGELIFDCVGHKDSVVFAAFSFDGTFLATGDMSGIIKVWKCNTDTQQVWSTVFEFEADDLQWGTWHFGTNVLIVGGITGDIYVFKIPSGETKVLKGHNVGAECGKIFPDGIRLAVGYADGSIKLWDLKTSSVLHQLPANVHKSKVTALDVHSDNNLVASISSDGNIILSTNSRIVGQLEAGNDLETIAFSRDPQLGYLVSGTIHGNVIIWDVARQMIRHQCAKPQNDPGVSKIIWTKNYLIAGCLDGSVRIFESRSGAMKCVLTGHESEVLDLCYNEKENVLLTCSDDGTARIFKHEFNKEND